MMTDERLDQLIRASMEWRSAEAARTQPTLRQATGRLAARMVQPGTAVRPRLSLSPATGGSMNLMLLLALLLLLGVAIYVGAQLLRQPSFVPPPGPFGFAADCSIAFDAGLAFDEPDNATVLRFTAPDGPDADQESDYLAVYAEGRLVQDISQPGETRVDAVTGEQLSVRRLSPEGVALMLARVADAGLSPGCRFLQTQQATGTLTARTAAGATEASWGPTGTATSYHITPDAERALLELNEDLAHPERWLPPAAWLDQVARPVRSHHWLIYLELIPSGHDAGDEIHLADGTVLSGSDPRIRSVELPGGAEPLSYGTRLGQLEPAGPGSSIRCAEGTTEDALALASSLDEFAVDELFTYDLAWSVMFRTQPVYGAGYDCADLAATWQLAGTPTATASPLPPTGDLADVDPCSLVSVDAAALLGANDVERWPSRLPLGIPAHSCVVLDSTVEVDLPADVVDALPPGYRAIVSLYPRNVSGGLAQEVVDAVFGPGLVPEESTGQRLWVRSCAHEMMPCSDVIIGWTRSHLVFFEFTNAATPIESVSPSGEWTLTWQPQLSPEQARQFVDAVMDNIAQD